MFLGRGMAKWNTARFVRASKWRLSTCIVKRCMSLEDCNSVNTHWNFPRFEESGMGDASHILRSENGTVNSKLRKGEHQKPNRRPNSASNESSVDAEAKYFGPPHPHPHHPHLYTFGTVHRTFHKELYRQKLAGKWKPHKLIDEKTNKKPKMSECCTWPTRREANKWRISSQKMGPGYSFTVSPANVGTKQSWVQMTIDTRPRFQSRKRVFSIFFDDQGSVSVGYLPANSTSRVHGMQKQFCPKSFRAVSTQSPAPRASSSTTMPVPTKQGR